MNKASKIVLFLGISLLAIAPVMAQNASPKTQPQPPLQDFKKAVEFFETELNYTTNPHGVNSAIEGKVKDITIVDVRSAEEFAKGHIPGAINLPHEKYNSFDSAETEFPGLRKDGYNYVYCYQLLCNLAQKAAKNFASLGYPVKEMVGGFEEWKKHNYPIEK